MLALVIGSAATIQTHSRLPHLSVSRPQVLNRTTDAQTVQTNGRRQSETISSTTRRRHAYGTSRDTIAGLFHTILFGKFLKVRRFLIRWNYTGLTIWVDLAGGLRCIGCTLQVHCRILRFPSSVLYTSDSVCNTIDIIYRFVSIICFLFVQCSSIFVLFSIWNTLIIKLTVKWVQIFVILSKSLIISNYWMIWKYHEKSL